MALFHKNEKHVRQGQESTGCRHGGVGCTSRGNSSAHLSGDLQGGEGRH